MNLTDLKTVAIAALMLSGCASQDTIIPNDGTEMIDIYRGAMAADLEVKQTHEKEALGVCEELSIDESKESCIRKVNQVLDEQRLAIDTNPKGETLDYVPYTRTQQNELDNLFPRLPNPDLVIYVYPHLATSARAPIPGYSTVIPLYERVQYRLPGESLAE